MKTNRFTWVVLAATLSSGASAWCAEGNAKQDALYSDGTRAINDGRWQEAESIFSNLATQHGPQAEAALYWKAYAENKEGKSAQALKTCLELKVAYPHGKWMDECGALEIEIRGKSHDPLPPQEEQDEDLKLLALNSLMQQDEARALPVIRGILNSDKPERLKTRALFVLAQDSSPQAQELIGQVAHNDHDPGLQRRAIEMTAISRGSHAADFLADIYRETTNVEAKKAVLRTYQIMGTPDPLLRAATHETNPELVRTAVQGLGAMGAVPQLLTLYQNNSSTQAKGEILNGLVISGQKGADALRSIVSSEQDPALRVRAIRNLGIAGGASTAPYLLPIYQKNADLETRKAVVQALFLAGDGHDLVELARAEKDPAAKKEIVQQLSLLHSKEATDYMLEILNK